MITKFQFDSVQELVIKGVKDYIQIRQQAGLTAAELDDVIENYDYYKKYFDDQTRLIRHDAVKKHWWQRS